MAEEHTLTAVEGEKVAVPATQKSYLAFMRNDWIRQIGDGGNPRSSF